MFTRSVLVLVLANLLMAPVNAEGDKKEADHHHWALKPINYDVLEAALKGDGLQGWVHAAVNNSGIYVFTWRDPQNFFRFTQFPMVPANEEVAKTLRTLKRHDYLLLKGAYADHEAPQKHIEVAEIKVLEEYTEGLKHREGVSFPEELFATNELIGKVHIVAGDGRILVIEYKDSVIPVYVKEPSYTRDLYRNDKIRLRYKVQKHPKSPRHLQLDIDANEPLEVLDRMVEQHGQDTTLTGNLVMFPKSPQIKFDIYALQVVDKDGVKRNYTLVNFESMETFHAIRKKLDKVWKKTKATAQESRNKWINPFVKVRATGVINVMTKGQANPQIMLDSLDSVEAYRLHFEWRRLEISE